MGGKQERSNRVDRLEFYKGIGGSRRSYPEKRVFHPALENRPRSYPPTFKEQLKSLGLQPKAYNCLIREWKGGGLLANVHSLEDLRQCPDDVFAEIRQFGEKSLEDLRAKIGHPSTRPGLS